MVNDIDAERGAATAETIEKAGGKAIFVLADVSKEEEVARLVDRAVDQFGALHCAVNNAGTEYAVAVEASDAAAFSKVLATNLEGVRACIKHEIRAMRRSGGGAIVNMSSVTSDLTAVPQNGLYAASKGGVDALTKAAAVEVAKEGISVNVVGLPRGGCRRRHVPAVPRHHRHPGAADHVGAAGGQDAASGGAVRGRPLPVLR